MFLLNIKEYLKYKGITEQGLYKQFRNGKNKAHKINNKNYVMIEEDFEDVLEKSKNKYKKIIDTLKLKNKELEEKEFSTRTKITSLENYNKDYLYQIDRLEKELKEYKNRGFFQRIFEY